MEFWSSFFEKTASDNCHTLVCLASFGVSFYFCGSFWLLLVFCSVLKYNFYRFLYVLSAAIIVNSPDQGSLRPSPFPWASRSLLSSKWDLDSRSELEQQSRGVTAAVCHSQWSQAGVRAGMGNLESSSSREQAHLGGTVSLGLSLNSIATPAAWAGLWVQVLAGPGLCSGLWAQQWNGFVWGLCAERAPLTASR